MTFPLHERDGRLIKGTSRLVAHKAFSIPSLTRTAWLSACNKMRMLVTKTFGKDIQFRFLI